MTLGKRLGKGSLGVVRREGKEDYHDLSTISRAREGGDRDVLGEVRNEGWGVRHRCY